MKNNNTMETVLKSCITSASYIISGPTNARSNKDALDSSCGKAYACRRHSAHFPLGKVVTPSPGGSAYVTCNFPSTPLPCNGNISKEKMVTASSKCCDCQPYKESTSGSTLRAIPSSTYSTTCPSLRLKPLESSSAGEERWIRPLGYAERFMTWAGQWGNMSTVYALWLDSGGPISFESIKYTSHLIFRKMPHLRLCIDNHKGDRWWKEMASDHLDVEEIKSDEDVITIFESLLKKQYNIKDGPLWFIRFITSVNGNDLVRDSNYNLKHKYVCIFGFHHNVSDGTTNMNFCNIFISLLNNVLNNKEVDLKVEGRFAYPIHDDLANSTISYSFLLQLFGVRIYKGLIAYCEYVKNFLKHYPMPNNTDGCTLVLQNELDEVTTERLLKRCKMEGVTLNTAFTAAANIGMLRMILQRDSSVTETRFDSQQAVNMRRYWPRDKQKNAFGCHISMVDIQIPTTKEDIKNFWEYSRKVHKIIYHELNIEKRTLKMQPLSEKLWLAIFVNSWMSKLRLPSANDSHYCITNMGDVSSTLAGETSVVHITKILRSVSCHFMQALCQHTLQTFKGKFYYSLDYYPQKMSVGTARAYASSLMDTLRTSIHMPN